jgi:hypothetical protein
VMYQTFMSFDYTLFNTQWMFATGLIVGWTATSISNVCLKSAQRQELASRVRGSMWVLFYDSIALAIQVEQLSNRRSYMDRLGQAEGKGSVRHCQSGGSQAEESDLRRQQEDYKLST